MTRQNFSTSGTVVGCITSRSVLAVIAIGMLGLSCGCSSLPGAEGPTAKTASVQNRSRMASRSARVQVTTIRDPLVRSEIRSELNALKDYQKSLKELRARYEKIPLPGPITLEKLENDLTVAYLARTMAPTETAPKAVGESSPPLESAAPPAAPPTTPTALAAQANPPTAGIPPLTPFAPFARKPSTASDTSDVAADDAGVGLAGIPPESREPGTLKRLGALDSAGVELSASVETPLIFDYPVTYNAHVRRWIHYFQTTGRSSFRNWLERSSRFLPFIHHELTRAGLPQDLSYVAMIESGFVPSAVSHASAMGLWQFIAPTGHRYGLRTEWWLDERRDFQKSTQAAISYMTDLYRQFNSWYLVAASYNMGENGVRRLMQRHATNNFWELADRGALPEETRHYVPKIIAAMLISKAPALYGFRDLDYKMPFSYEFFTVPGGTDLVNLASHLGVSEKYLKELNPELIKGFIPRHVKYHRIRIPKGAASAVAQYVRVQSDS